MDKVSGNSKRVSAKGGANRAKGSSKTGRSVNRDAAGRPKNAGNVHLISGQEAREREVPTPKHIYVMAEEKGCS